MRSKPLFWFCVSIVTHYIVTLSTLLLSFGATMDRFESGGTATTAEKITAGANAVLSFPLVPLLLQFSPIRFRGLSGHIPLRANSTLWAAAIMSVWMLLRKKATNRPPRPNRTAGFPHPNRSHEK